MKLTFLGTGTSVGVPMIGCHCRVCTSPDPRNKRQRTSLYVETPEIAILIDTSPDLRQQALRWGIERVDAVLFTHAHADHILGLDDIRRFNTLKGGAIPAYGDPITLAGVQRVFHYIGATPPGSGLYRPLVSFQPVEAPFTLGKIRVTPLKVEHGIQMTGYLLEYGRARIGYVPDCCRLPDESIRLLQDVDIMILDTLRYRPHPAHLSVDEALDILSEINARESYMIHLCHDVEHSELEAILPHAVYVSYDGLSLQVEY